MVDMKMPELSGIELLQIAEQELSGSAAIVISGYNDFEYTRQAIRSKVVDYLLKPVNRTDLNMSPCARLSMCWMPSGRGRANS